MVSFKKEENPWGYAKRLNFILESIERFLPGETAKLLDIGCGNGSQVAIPLASCGFSVMGVDPDPQSIENALAHAPATACFRCCTLEQIEERNFNVVILSEVLEHLQEPELLLREAIEHLSDGGVLIVTVPNGYGEFELDKYIFTKLRVERLIARFRQHHASISSSDNHDGHVQWFRLGRLRAMFLRNGLELIHKGSGPLACGPLAVYAFNHLPRTALKWNACVTDHLPMSFASGWYFVLSRASGTRI